MTVAVYHKSVPNLKNLEKVELLKHFSTGVNIAGDGSIDIENTQLYEADVAVIQGWAGPGNTSSTHLNLRKQVIQHQWLGNKHTVIADSSLFLYSNISNIHHYLRYSFDGIFPNTGIYCDSNIDPVRWQKISKNLNLSLKDYRTSGDHILLCLQRNGGWSMGTVDIQEWAVQTINTIRQFTDRPIVVRLHPGDKTSKGIIQLGNPNCKIKFSKRVSLSTNVNLVDDLVNCWAAVNYNSSPVVGAAIEGIPIFVMEPAKSQCAEVANTDLSQIENPTLHDRQLWAERLSMFHWNFDELRSGECWSHMKKFIKRRIC
jgi:hypothetical protein